MGSSTNFLSGNQGLQLNSNGTATDMNSGQGYGANMTISVGNFTVKTGIVLSESSRTNLFLKGLGNATLGTVGTVGSAAYCIGTEGIGAAIGGGVALTLSIGEVAIGMAQMADAFNTDPDTILHEYSTLPGLISAKNGSDYAPLIDGASGWATGSLSGGNVDGAIDALSGLAKGENVIQNTTTIVDTASDGTQLIQSIAEPKKGN
jgi:hypothetical protein